MKKIILALAFVLATLGVYAQSATITGSIQSAMDKAPLPGASVLLVSGATSATTASVTDAEGRFRFERVAPGEYTIKVNYLGFKPFNRTITMQGTSLNLGQVILEEASTAIGEVEVIGRAPLGEQKGDTSQFNAKAFKTAPDASAEDLVTKMPGITIQDGKIQAQGEEVKQVMIDGKRYAGTDVNSAVRNLSADMIESVQVFDGQSDRAAFSGFDDGNRMKTLNFTTKKDRRQGYMGKISAGYGTDERYMVGASVNYFNNNQRITVMGLTNNINMFDFSVGETPGGGMRGRRGWGGGSPNGIINTNTFGVNYNDMWGKKIEVSGSYNYSNRDIVNNQYRFRDFVNSDRTYNEYSINNDQEDNHRLNFRLQYNINENNRLLVTPAISVQQSDNYTLRDIKTLESTDILSTSLNRNTADNISLNFSNNILYSHRFGNSGRILTTSFNTNYSSTDQDEFQFVDSEDVENGQESQVTDQFIRLDRSNFSWEGNADYSQRLGENSRLQLEYTIGNQQNDSDRRTFDRSTEGGPYNDANVPLSNTFKSDYLSQRFGPSYQYRNDNTRFQASIRYQIATLNSDTRYPQPDNMRRDFNDVLPAVEFEQKFSESSSFTINYRTNTNVPSVDQLQDVLNIANPQQPRIGNPELQQDYQNRLQLRYRNFNAETNRVFFVGVFGSMNQDYIANSVYTEDYPLPFALPEGYTRPAGARLTRPVNLDGYWNVRSFLNYGQPLTFIKSNINFHGSLGFSRTPGMTNEQINFANNTSMSAGMNISSNISEKIDFMFFTSSSYNIVENTLSTRQNNNYFTQNSMFRLNSILWKGLVYRTEMNHQYNSGLSEGVDNGYLLWNMSLGKKIFKNQQGEISLSVNDLLQQNVSVQRNIASDYIEDVQSTVLQRYFMLTFTYNLRKFKSGEAPDMNNQRGNWGGGRRPGH